MYYKSNSLKENIRLAHKIMQQNKASIPPE